MKRNAIAFAKHRRVGGHIDAWSGTTWQELKSETAVVVAVPGPDHGRLLILVVGADARDTAVRLGINMDSPVV
jgi:hypothetical protein